MKIVLGCLAILFHSVPCMAQMLRASGTLSYFGMNGDNGFGSDIGILKQHKAWDKLSLWYGLRSTYFPSLRLWEYSGDRYGEKFYGSTIIKYEKSKVFYFGAPFDLTYTFRSGRVSPFITFGNRLDVKAYETVKPIQASGFDICNDIRPNTCLSKSDFSIVGEFLPVVWKTELLLGSSIRMMEKQLLVDFGIQLDATQRRAKNRTERSRTPSLKSGIGFVF